MIINKLKGQDEWFSPAQDLPAMASAASSKSRNMLGHLLQQIKSGGDGHRTEIVDSGNSTVPCWKSFFDSIMEGQFYLNENVASPLDGYLFESGKSLGIRAVYGHLQWNV